MKVLLVDDDPVVLEVTRAVLQSLGHEVVTRDHALGTTAVICTERPQVVLMDVQMPGVSGDELIRIVRDRGLLADDQRTVFILYSGRSSEELERLVADTGALGAIQKTDNPVAMGEAFQRLVEQIEAAA